MDSKTTIPKRKASRPKKKRKIHSSSADEHAENTGEVDPDSNMNTRASSSSGDRSVVRPDYLQTLPFETLAEVLSYSSLLAILSVTRCSRWLCQTLTQPDAAVIWKNARARCTSGSIPDPPPNLPEPAYAAALFDGGCCSICNIPVKGPPKYFPIKFFICSLESCTDAIPDKFYRQAWDGDAVGYLSSAYRGLADQHLAASLVVYRVRASDATFQLSVYRPERDQGIKEWQAAGEDEPAKANLINEWTNKATRRTSYIQKHSDLYDKWYMDWLDRMTSASKATKLFWQKKVTDNNWPRQPFINLPTFQRLLRVCTREDEALDDTHWSKHSATIIEEIEALTKIHANRKLEHARLARQRATEFAWRMGKNNPEVKDLMPSVKTFRNLPLVRSLEKDDSITDLKQTLQSQEVQKVVKSGLQAWNETTRRVLSGKLGFRKAWKPDPEGSGGSGSSATPRLHPLDRMSSLFECKRCHRNGRIFTPTTSLTFYEVIKHRCPKNTLGPTGKQRREWDITNFEPDTVAIRATRLALQVAGEDEERASTQVLSKKFVGDDAYRWQCMTCPSRITLRFDMVAGHAKRHKAQSERDALAAGDEAQPGSSTDPRLPPDTLPLSFSLRFVPVDDPLPEETHEYSPNIEWLMGVAKTAVKARTMKNFLCRHCTFFIPNGTGAKKKNVETVLEDRAMSMDGLRSHLASKHGIAPVRGEDFCCLGDARAVSQDIVAETEKLLNEVAPTPPVDLGDVTLPLN
ncbi:hypothetical protein FRB95_001490 [Tulasnella sp. JGI-2019a]|nr:hypothetical protein FRB95_001490 [Tulasnella sp. JGI-2019a]